MNSKFNILVAKHLTDGLDIEQAKELESIINNDSDCRDAFFDDVAHNAIINQVYSSKNDNVNATEAFNSFLHTVKPNPKKSKFNLLTKVAASVLVLISAFSANYLLKNSSNNKTAIIIPDEKIILYSQNGESTEILIDNKQESSTVKDSEQIATHYNVAEHLFEKGKNFGAIKEKLKITDFTIKVPFGKKFGLTLSDGTKVYLNSGSSITYPSKFDNSEQRVVSLNGEAFFEVTTNKKKPFIVKTDLLSVRVLGTKFNISAYKNDETSSVTLVEGKVAVSKPAGLDNKNPKSILLNPNQKAFVKRSSKDKIAVNQVANLGKHISWKNKELEFKNDKFIDIVKKLERNFNVKIISNSNTLNNIEFTGKFFNKQDVFDILDVFSIHTPFKYTVENNSIVIKK